MTTHFILLFERDFQTLAKEISSYSKEENLWLKNGQVNNNAANLCIHICGNLQHFIGAVLGKTGYVRDRDFEFGGTGVSREQMLESIDTTGEVVKRALLALTPEQLGAPYPIPVGREWVTEEFLLHLYGHLNYHLGQITYHRRLLDK